MKSIGILCTVIILSVTQISHAHCQVPCGIYNDAVRVTLLLEHVTTIEKSMNEIATLSAQGDNPNQLVRWVNNKEEHADAFAEIVTAYFMAQRIKPASPDDSETYKTYQTNVEILHRMLVASMKTKQSIDLAYCTQLRELIQAFQKSYPIEQPHHH